MEVLTDVERLSLTLVCRSLLSSCEKDFETWSEIKQAAFERQLLNGKKIQIQVLITEYEGDFLPVGVQDKNICV